MTNRKTKISIAIILVALALALGLATVALLNTRTTTMPVVSPSIRSIAEKNLVDIEEAIKSYNERLLTTNDPPWVLFHCLLGRLDDYAISGEDGETYSCLSWLLTEASWRPMFKMTPLTTKRNWGVSFTHGPTPGIKMEFEDHSCQFLFILMELGVCPQDTVICVPPNGENHALVEVVQAAENSCHGLSDLSWALPVFAKWGTRSKWTNKFGSEFELNRLFAQHLKREEWCTACFGTHWRMGLALGLKYGHKKISKNLRIQAKQRLCEAILEARNSQDDSGQFRLQWGLYPPRPPDIDDLPPLPSDFLDLLSHQGHMLEWLMVALSDEDLSTQEWPHQGISWLLTKLSDAKKDIPYGTHSHCAHALRLYESRMNKLLDTQ